MLCKLDATVNFNILAFKDQLEIHLVELESQLQSLKQALCAAAKKALKPNNVSLVASNGTEFLMDEPTLLQSSPYFAGLFGGGFAEHESRVVNYDDVEPTALECVCMAICCGAHPEAAFDSFPPTVLIKALEFCVRIQVPDTLVEANAEAIVAKLDNFDVPVALELLGTWGVSHIRLVTREDHTGGFGRGKGQ